MVDEYLKELRLILGNADVADEILGTWLGMAAIYGDTPKKFFTGGDVCTAARRLDDLNTVLGHIDGLIPLLNNRLAWVTACNTPEILEGPEIAAEYEQRMAAIKESLSWLRVNVNLAVEKSPPVHRGRSLELTPKLMLIVSLIACLKEAGIPMGTGERSKMVRAVRTCWDAAGFEGDPRDLLRSMEKKGAQIAKLQ